MRRLVLMCAARRMITVAVLAVTVAAVMVVILPALLAVDVEAPFAKSGLARTPRSVMAGSTGSLTLQTATPVSGCPLLPLYSFCSQLTGGTTAPAQFTLTASSAVTGLTISLAAVKGPESNLFTAGDFTVENTTCGAALASGASCNINVSLTPASGIKGARAAALTVTDAAKDTAIVNMIGTTLNNASGGGAIGLVPPPAPACPQDNAFTYCPQAVHTASGTQNFLLTSGATVTGLTFSFAAVPGLTSEFALSDFTIVPSGGLSCGTTLVQGASCTVGVQFTPTTTGMRAATLTATDAGGDATVVYLAGSTTSGLAITPPVQVPACSPGNTFEFCNTPMGGSASSTEAFTLTNTSGVQVTGVNVPTATTAGDFKVTGTSCVTVLAANASCTMNVLFTPANTGLVQEPLVVIDADGDTVAANLTGTGDDYSIVLPSTQPVEVSVAQGGTATFNAQVIPDAVFGLDGEQVTFACPSTAQLPIDTSCVISPCPTAVTAGGMANITITFVTSSKTVLAPLPEGPAGCESYGPAPLGAFLLPPSARTQHRGPWRFPSGILPALLATLALGTLAVSLRRRRAHQTIFLAAALAAAILIGCHHPKTIGQATPLGTTMMNIQAVALDSKDGSLNTGRIIQGLGGAGFVLDVIQATNKGGGGGLGGQ